MIRSLDVVRRFGKLFLAPFGWLGKRVRPASSVRTSPAGGADKALLSSRQPNKTFWKPFKPWKTLQLRSPLAEPDLWPKEPVFKKELERIAEMLKLSDLGNLIQIDLLDTHENRDLTHLSGNARVTYYIVQRESIRGIRYLFLIPKEKSHPADYSRAYQATLDLYHDWRETQIFRVIDRVGDRAIKNWSFHRDKNGYIRFTDGVDEQGNERVFECHRRLLRTSQEVEQLKSGL